MPIFAPDRSTVAMVLAGGQGQRLYPLTRDRAKPAVPFAGIYRIIDFTLSNCVNSGIRRIHLLTQYKSYSLERHIREAWQIFSSELGEFIDILPPQQRTVDRWYEGTADAFFQNLYTIEQEKPERIVVLSGDHLYKMDYSRLLRFHLEHEADLTIACVEVDQEAATRLGVVYVDEDYRLVDFAEKPENPSCIPGKPGRCLASMGVYVFDTMPLVRNVIRDQKQPESDHDFGKNIIPTMVKSERVFAYPFVDEKTGESEYWRDIGTRDSYYEANMELVAENPPFNLYNDEWPIRSYHPQVPPAKTTVPAQGAKCGELIGSLAGGGSVIAGGRVERSVLGHCVRVEEGAEVTDSIIMSDSVIGKGARIHRTIIDKEVVVPAGEQIGLDVERDRRRFALTSNGVVAVPKGIPLGDERR